MSGELAAALDVDRRVRERAASEVIRIPEGVVVRHPELWDVHYLNAVILEAAPPTPGVVALADRWLGELGHRHVVFENEAAGERAAAALPGWERRRTSLMVFGGDLAAVPRDPRARQISPAEMESLHLTGLREDVPEAAVRSGLADRLAATQRALRAGTAARCFGAGDGSGLQSMCTLFLDEDVGGRRVGLIDEVATLAAHRRRGLARAVVGAAIAAAAAWPAELIVVPTDADDWPQIMYAGLGFVAVGRQVSLTRRIRSAGTGL